MCCQTPLTRILSLLLTFGLLVSLGGCSSLLTDDFRDPEVRLLKVDVVKAKLLEQKFVLRFRVDNPNDMSLPIRGLNYNVKLNGVLLAEGQSDKSFTVPARGHQNFDVPVRTNLWRHLKRIVNLLDDPHKPLIFQPRGEGKTGLVLGAMRPLQAKGELLPRNFAPGNAHG